jgi:hypothetical protein
MIPDASLYLEDEGSMVLRNVGILPHRYNVKTEKTKTWNFTFKFL